MLRNAETALHLRTAIGSVIELSTLVLEKQVIEALVMQNTSGLEFDCRNHRVQCSCDGSSFEVVQCMYQ